MAKEIRIGSLLFQEASIESITYHGACNLAGEELSEDTIDVSVFFDDSENILRSMPDGTPIFYYNDGNLVTKLYKSRLERTARARYRISGTSIVGLLSKEMFYGGMYSGQLLSSVVESIILTDGLRSDTYNRYAKIRAVRTAQYQNTNYSMGTMIHVGTEGQPTIRSHMLAKFKVVSLNPSWGGGAYISSAICGSTVGQYADHSAYGIEYYSGRNTSPEDGSLWLCMWTPNGSDGGRTLIPNVKLHDGDTVEVDIDTVAEYATLIINGVETTMDISFVKETYAYQVNGLVSSAVYGGGAENCYIDVEYDYYKIYGENGDLLIDATAYTDVSNGTLYLENAVDGYTAAAVSSVPSQYAPYSGSDPGFIKVSEAMATIMNDIEMESRIRNIRVFGWIKTGRKREALYQLLFSQSLNLRHKADGGIKITTLADGVVAEIDDDRIYDSGSERPFDNIRSIALTEHAYSALADSETIFDNSDVSTPSGTYIAEFEKAPVFGTPTASDGLTIIAYNANCALVSGKGTISARPYLHSTSIIEQQISEDLDGKNVSVTGATMVTFVNSDVVFDRLKAYYNPSLSLIKNAIVAGGEKCGSEYAFTGPFGDPTEAFLQKIDATASAITKFNCEFVRGYVPPERSGGDYSKCLIFTRSTQWTVPSGTSKLRVVLIGGGSGGSSGLAGEDGAVLMKKTDQQLSGVRGAKGGSPGVSGESGKIYEVEITSPASTYSVVIGSGGRGGSTCYSTEERNPGSAGGNSTFGSYSSASGIVRPAGISNIFNGEVYANETPNYKSGEGYGADGGYPSYDSTEQKVIYHDGGDAVNPFTGTVYHGGTNGSGFSAPAIDIDFCSGGFGSGATCSMDGINGSDSVFQDYGGAYGYTFGYGGTGWEPGSPQSPSGYGRGGYGGFGGSGGGAGYYYQGDHSQPEQGRNGKGGGGGPGANGTQGCVIVYY